MSKPKIFTTAYATDKMSWLHLSDDVGFMEHIKNHLGERLAERIFQECQSGEKIVAVNNFYKTEIHEINQVEIRGRVSIEDLVRCKDCKHRPIKPDNYNPITTDGFALEFPDEKCPCQCSDGWYSKYPDDDWFCPNGERRSE